MQSMEVIYINLWHIIISLANLVILFLIMKKFLFKPVKKVLDERQKVMDEQYASAAQAEADANHNKEAWEEKIKNANSKADAIVQDATAKAQSRSDKIVADAHKKAEGILRQAETEAVLERKKAEAGIKREIVDVSSLLTEKMLGREINTQDHRAMIDSFIEGLDGDSDGDE